MPAMLARSSSESGRTTRAGVPRARWPEDPGARGDHGAGANLGAALDQRTVEHPGTDAYQRAVFDSAAVEDGSVPDDDALAERQRVGLVGDVEDGTVLDVAARPDADPVDVAAGDGVEPERHLVPELDVAGDPGRRREEDVRAESRRDAGEGE
jgi:hypothetical protein